MVNEGLEAGINWSSDDVEKVPEKQDLCEEEEDVKIEDKPVEEENRNIFSKFFKWNSPGGGKQIMKLAIPLALSEVFLYYFILFFM
jgi:hypothetical protein